MSIVITHGGCGWLRLYHRHKAVAIRPWYKELAVWCVIAQDCVSMLAT
jgi:hypothetical protein